MKLERENILRQQLEQRNERIVEMVKDRDARLRFGAKKLRLLRHHLNVALAELELYPDPPRDAVIKACHLALKGAKKPYRARKR